MNTPVCATLGEVRDAVRRSRRALAEAAEREGLRLAAAATHPFSHWRDQAVTDKTRYLNLAEDYRQVFREQVVFGCHVHVGIEDREAAIQTMNRVRPWLPVLLALSGNSPYWLGADTGYASYRTEVWNRWPTAGMPQPFASRGVDEAVMVAGLARALARTCHDAAARGDPDPRPRPELLRAAKWRAARHGLDADLVDVLGGHARPAAEMVGRFVAEIRPGLEAAGDLEEVTELVGATVARGTGAARQRAAFERTGSLEAVVDLVVEETAG
jgi:carboxylate-amine ligase